MNILIISNYFYPQNLIASFRINAFAKYFHEAGHDVTVLTVGDKDIITQWEGCEVHYLKDLIMSERKLQIISKSPRKWTLQKILLSLEYCLALDCCLLWRIRAKKYAAKILENKKMDVVLTTFGDLSAHIIGLSLKKKNYKFYWIADMRDEMSRRKYPNDIRMIGRRMAAYEKRVVAKADLVTSVSKPILDDFRKRSNHNRFLEIRNGYEYEEVYDSNYQKTFTMGYIGQFYNDITPDNFFKAYSELLSNGELPSDSKIKIVGNSTKLDIPETIRPNVEEIAKVTHDEALRISIYETDTLIMIHPKGRKGVYSGKLLDYLATNKPILSIYDPNDVTGKLLMETRAGFVADESDIEDIKKMILKCYYIWKNREVLPRNWDVIKKHHRRYQTNLLLKSISLHINKD